MFFKKFFMHKNTDTPETPKMRRYKVVAICYNGDCECEVNAHNREEAARIVMDTTHYDCRKYLSNDERDYTSNILGIRYVIPV